MNIQHEEENGAGRFFINEDGADLAEMVYSRREKDVLVILHTEVDESLAGKGVGKMLLAETVAYARANHFQIVPVCAFAKRVMEHSHDYDDVLGKKS